MLIKNILTSVSDTYNFINKDKVIFLNTGDVSKGKILNNNFIDIALLPGQAKKSIKYNDLLYSEIRPINKHYALVNINNPENYVVSTKLMVLRNKNANYDMNYLYQFLISDKVINNLQALAESRSGTFPQITYEILSMLEVPDISLEEQQHIVNILGSIDDKIENLEKINTNLIKLIQYKFNKIYLTYTAEDQTNIINNIVNMISGDWGKDFLEGNYCSCVKCIRGADIPMVKSCNFNKLPKRFILKRNEERSKLKAYDVIIELSGGSPTQSTGRCCIIPENILDHINQNLISSNFCKVLRFKEKKVAVFCYLLLSYWYDSGLFFNYELGTTGLKNLNLEAIININIKQLSEEILDVIYNNFKISYNKIVKNSNKINKFNLLKQLYLKKFFG